MGVLLVLAGIYVWRGQNDPELSDAPPLIAKIPQVERPSPPLPAPPEQPLIKPLTEASLTMHSINAMAFAPLDEESEAAKVAVARQVELDTETPITRSDSGTYNIELSDTDIGKVLRMLSSQSQKNILVSKDVRGNVSANLHNVTIKEALDAILRANGFAYRDKGNVIYVYTTRELSEVERSERMIASEVFHVYYTPAENAVNMIKPVLSPDAIVAVTKSPELGIESSGAKGTGGNCARP